MANAIIGFRERKRQRDMDQKIKACKDILACLNFEKYNDIVEESKNWNREDYVIKFRRYIMENIPKDQNDSNAVFIYSKVWNLDKESVKKYFKESNSKKVEFKINKSGMT